MCVRRGGGAPELHGQYEVMQGPITRGKDRVSGGVAG